MYLNEVRDIHVDWNMSDSGQDELAAVVCTV